MTSSLYPSICYAVFEDLRNMYKADKFSVIKRAPKLNSKACWPSKLERQNVNLALKIFHESTAAGLLRYAISHKITHQTFEFLNLINKVWNIFNVNWVGKNIRFNAWLSKT